MAGMLKNKACQENSDLRRQYVLKMVSVLGVVAKALQRLHSVGVIHGNLTPEACGKFGDRWKLLKVFGFQKVGRLFDAKSCGESVPPEALEPDNNVIAVDRRLVYRSKVAADPSIDMWGFGKLSHDVLVGHPLTDVDPINECQNVLLRIQHWGTLEQVQVRCRLRKIGVPDAFVNLITKCLSQDPSHRPSIDEVLQSGHWDNIHQIQSPLDLSNLHEC